MNIKTFYEPFRADYFSSHLRTTHKNRFNEYCTLCPSEKDAYFEENENAENANIRSFVQPKCGSRAKQLLKEDLRFTIDEDIVEEVIGNLLFDKVDDEDNEKRKKSLRLEPMRNVKNREKLILKQPYPSLMKQKSWLMEQIKLRASSLQT